MSRLAIVENDAVPTRYRERLNELPLHRHDLCRTVYHPDVPDVARDLFWYLVGLDLQMSEGEVEVTLPFEGASFPSPLVRRMFYPMSEAMFARLAEERFRIECRIEVILVNAGPFTSYREVATP